MFEAVGSASSPSRTVPSEALAALVAPAAALSGPAEAAVLAIWLVTGFRLPMMVMFAIGWAVIVALRAAGL